MWRSGKDYFSSHLLTSLSSNTVLCLVASAKMLLLGSFQYFLRSRSFLALQSHQITILKLHTRVEICCSVFCCCRYRCQEDAVVITARGRAVPHHCDGETRHMHQGTCLTFSRSRTKTLSPKDKPRSAYAPVFFSSLPLRLAAVFFLALLLSPLP